MKAEIFNYSTWINNVEQKKLKESFNRFLTKSGFTIISQIEHEFLPFGYTGLWLLAESHFAIHTFPEENKTYIELSSCNESMYHKFISAIENEYRETNSEH